MKRFLVLGLILAAGGLAAFAPPPPGAFEVRLTPSRMDAKAGRGSLDVDLRIPAADAPSGSAVLALPIVVANVDTVAATLTGLTVRDDLGPLPLSVRDDPEATVYLRHWIAGRAVKGALAVHYTAPVDNTPPLRGTGPPYSLRTEGGGVSGVGYSFILLPEDQRARPISLHWDLKALGPEARGMSSFGEGDVTLAPGPVGRLGSALYMAGAMHREPTPVAANGFSAAWLGEPPFDPKPLMVWAGKLHGWMSGFFKDTAEPPYRVILRYNPINAGGGAAMTNSFLLTWGATAKDPEKLKGTLAHEMIHTWTATGLGGQWYGEGIAVHYQGLLPLRAGMITPAAFLDDLNATARRYYTNALNDTPDSQVAARFWEDTRIRTLPYDRGAMYFAVLDGKIRRASGGKRSLDDLINEMVRRRRSGGATSEAAWLELLDREIGADGRRLHSDMLTGRLMVPASDDFGPCFTRTTARFRRFELGFEPKSLVGNTKTIRDLQPDSEAAKAGLRNGDVVTYSVAMDSVQGDPTRMLSLQVTREGRSFSITYLPRGDAVDAYQWARGAGVPDNRCAY